MNRRRFISRVASVLVAAPFAARMRQTLSALLGGVSALLPSQAPAIVAAFKRDPRKISGVEGNSSASKNRCEAAYNDSPVAANWIRITDAQTFPGDGDGPTWEFANRPLLAAWRHPGGDWRDSANVEQGDAHYATVSIVGAGDIELDVTAIALRLVARNTGLYINQISGNVKFASRTHPSNPGPRMHVTTTTGAFDVPCIADTWVSPSSNMPLGGQTEFDSPGMILFDLARATGNVTRATLTLNVSRTFRVPCVVAVDYLDCPSIAVDPHKAVQGIAATLAQDNALAAHPSVLLYDDLVSKYYIKTHFQGIASGPPTIDDNVEIVAWPQYKLSAARVWSIKTNQRIVSWHHWAEPKRGQKWQRDFGNGYTHLFLRYLIEVGTDVKAGMTEQGMKLPGMTGTYDWSSSGAVTLPQPNNDGTWEMRLWHSPQSAAHPDYYHLSTYFYGLDHPLSRFNNSPGGDNRFTSGYLKAGQVHCVEQEIQLNTLTKGVPDANGVERVWLDGVLVYEKTNIRIRGYDNVRIQSIPFVNIYHGGMGFPSAAFHYDIGGICVATEYIGPPKVIGSTSRTTPKARTSVLGQMAASMARRTWAEITDTNIDAVLGVGTTGDTEVAIPFTNSLPWDPLNRKIKLVAGDHADNPPRHIEYDDLTNSWALIDRTSGVGSHGYQHCAVNPFTGDLYLRNSTSTNILRYTNSGWVNAFSIADLSQVASIACTWWSGGLTGAGAQGAMLIYSGNTGVIYAYDPLKDRVFMAQRNILPGIVGYYHVVSAYSARKNCLVYGGGNNSLGGDMAKVIYRFNADGSKTKLSDAPISLGINHGANLVSDPASGNFLVWGSGQFWELNPSESGAWTRLQKPPSAVLDPSVAPNSLFSVDCSTHRVVIYVDAVRSRMPKCRMWLYKHDN